MVLTPGDNPGAREIVRGQIYREIYEKRLDTASSVMEADLEYCRLAGGQLKFDSVSSMNRAFTAGAFYLLMPETLDVAPADSFSQSFFLGDGGGPYGHFRSFRSELFNDSLLGFHERVDQIEQFILE